MLLMRTSTDPAARALRLKQGAKIKQYRTFHKLSQQQLADAVGVTKSAVSMWESGDMSPRPTTQPHIAAALNVPWIVVFGLDAETAS